MFKIAYRMMTRMKDTELGRDRLRGLRLQFRGYAASRSPVGPAPARDSALFRRPSTDRSGSEKSSEGRTRWAQRRMSAKEWPSLVRYQGRVGGSASGDFQVPSANQRTRSET
jgi:hypothetical protein